VSLKTIKQYLILMRINKPIGIFLLLWPTLWALWLASDGRPNLIVVCIFILGVVLMRSAGCIINDFADKDFDKHVERTRDRPLTSGKVSTKGALILFSALMVVAFLLVLLLNRLTILLAFAGAAFAVIYPFMKRFVSMPQLGLGIAFAWGVPMAFAALTNTVPDKSWVLFLAAAVWPVIYDTMYAMVDRIDDVKIGIKSTAITWGHADRLIVGLLQLVFILLLVACGFLFHLQSVYFMSLMLVSLFFIYQQWLIKDRVQVKCFQAFLNNHWVGMIIYVGIILSYSL
jgi:4-hydroxybenzoate polyprenyltransferase